MWLWIWRCTLVAALLFCGGCAREKKAVSLPETVAGGWRLQEVKRDGARTTGVYRGPGMLRVEVDDMGVGAVAFERAQRSRQEPNMVFFNKGNYFVVVRWEQADRGALKTFVQVLEKHLQ